MLLHAEAYLGCPVFSRYDECGKLSPLGSKSMQMRLITRGAPAAQAIGCRVSATALAVVTFAFIAILAPPHSLCAAQPDVPPQASGYKLAFEDNFNTLDLATDGPGEDQKSRVHTWYPGVWWSSKPTELGNISVSKSILALTWTRNHPGRDTRTSITTLSHDKRQFKAWRYGYFEARMRWDVVKGAWPAFWLIPVQDATGQNVYDGVKKTGEIDIFEGQGGLPHTFYGTIHEWWLNTGTDHSNRNNAFHLPEDADMSQFHTYGLLWKPGQVTWYFDNHPLHSEKTPEIVDRQDFYLVLTMQEGVNWTGDDLSGVTATRMTLNVDWVRVWQK